MPVYNSEKHLAEAIESILRQTLADFEFVIVDDGSTDGSWTIIQDCAARDGRIRHSRHPENRGEASARNTGLAQAAGKYVTGMDSDDVSLPQRLEKQVAFLEDHARIGAVGIFDRVCHEDLTLVRARRLPTRHHVMALHLLLFTKTVMRSSPMMLRRAYLESPPWYDPAIVVCADVDLHLRLLAEKGIRYANVPEELYLYRRHDDTQASRHQATHRAIAIDIRCQALRRLGAAGAGVEWIIRKHPLNKLSWRERRRARRDIARLIEALVEQNWVDAEDEPLLYSEMNQLLESTLPRFWQMCLHWYRHRIARHIQR